MRTDGNPLFAGQLLRHLAESGVVVQSGGWSVVGSLESVDLPDGVTDVVSQRPSRLSPAAKRALSVANYRTCGWTGWARDWTWPSTLAETAEMCARMNVVKHAEALASAAH